jgi:hypothetical protein
MNPSIATPKPITETGIKGFLLWYKREQPEIFAKIAPKLPAVVPKAFSNYNQTQRSLGKLYAGRFSERAPQRFGDYFTSYESNPVAIDLSDQFPPINVGTIDTGPITQPVFDSSSGTYLSPVAQAANTSVASTPTVAAIGQVIGAASQVYMTNTQAQLQQNVLQTQLQRAAQGLPPLNTSLAQLGVPVVSTGGSLGNSGFLFLLLGGVALVALTAGKKS